VNVVRVLDVLMWIIFMQAGFHTEEFFKPQDMHQNRFRTDSVSSQRYANN